MKIITITSMFFVGSLTLNNLHASDRLTESEITKDMQKPVELFEWKMGPYPVIAPDEIKNIDYYGVKQLTKLQKKWPGELTLGNVMGIENSDVMFGEGAFSTSPSSPFFVAPDMRYQSKDTRHHGIDIHPPIFEGRYIFK